ncbi:Eco57I restriction-modification methylase domain-containing protein [Aerococcaceae bacterium DSM 111176]|nr:Eco57I restriction-modification methylase domain-containing protein [Aerococcaceae bacterium DSM 111176]
MSKVIESLVTKFENNITTYKSLGFNEQSTRQEYIDIFLNELGWDVTNSQGLSYNDREVIVEEFTNSSDRPDYTISMYGSPIFFVEAKKVNVDILNSKESAFQARRYGWNAGHDIVILTNFEYLVIYQSYSEPKVEDTVSSYRYKYYHYSEYIEKFDEIYYYLSKESVLNDNFKSWISDITYENAKLEALDNVFLNQINEWRIQIGQELINNNELKYNNKIMLNRNVQTIINQIIFLRFAEDNRLEDSNTLHLLISEEINVFQFLEDLDKKYNSGLFDDDVILDISTKTLAKIIESLYYPNSSYDFSIIDLNILSSMYENYLRQELSINDGSVRLHEVTDRKIKSVVSTPIEVVRPIVKEALEDKVSNKSPEEIKKIKVLDIATGSGIFLVESFSYIMNSLIDYYSKVNNVAPNHQIVPFSDKVYIMKNMLYGLDINHLAVQITRFSLILRAMERESRNNKSAYPLLPELDTNIVHGNTLVSTKDLDLTKTSPFDINDIVPTNEKFFDNSFDVIIGNPPFLKIEDIKNSTTKIERNIYSKNFKSSKRQYDKYFLFIEKTLNLLGTNSNAVLIVQNKFLTNVAGKNLRKLLKEKRCVSKIINFKSQQLFPEADTYISIIKLQNNQDNFQYWEIKEIEDFLLDEPEIFSIDSLDDNGWFLTTNKLLLNQFRKANSIFPNILKEVEVSNGIQTSKNDVYFITANQIISDDSQFLTFKKDNHKFTIEKALLKPLYRKNESRDSSRSYYPIVTNSYIIFPYIEGEAINEDTLNEKFPKTYSYLLEYKHKLLPKDLGGTRDVQHGDKSIWYRFGRNQHLKQLDEPKIICGVLSNEPNFNIDRSNLMFQSGGTAGIIAIYLKDSSPYKLEYIQAWLSHWFTDDIFKVLGSSFQGEYYTHGTALYKLIPLLPIDFDNIHELISYNTICDNVNEIEAITELLLDSGNKHLEDSLVIKKDSLINQVNEILDKLFYKKIGESN